MFLYFEIFTQQPITNLASLALESTWYSAKEPDLTPILTQLSYACKSYACKLHRMLNTFLCHYNLTIF